ncbi:SPOR domain-containing protein [Leeuwenhoekiella sp. W20_SRS_FM14]|uniref:SPOR domain-containing protein n=1 Tax=Leeuwenhoekiella sp. W20_SRS_FM14 TaxID=3240270 RepID=UPI003F9AA228
MCLIIRILCLFFAVSGFSQGVSFQRVNEYYLHGDSRVIGNNILSSDSRDAYDRPRGINDQTEMVYVNIDDDSDTYSSSSADLKIPANTKIVYAGLYWAATYPGAVGKQKVRGGRIVYDLKKKRDRPFDLVQLKLPNKNEYIQVQGELVYDGMVDGNTDLKNAAPYVCYSDITQTLVANAAGSGTYTLANVAALEGEMYGGSSAGWMLYIVYEDAKAPLQYFTSYQGFRYISTEKPEELVFKNFRAVSKGDVKTSVILAGLEGDLALAKDVVSIYSNKQKKYIPLKSKVRFENNFFNSSITINDLKYLERFPSSSNTLGFDLAQIKIPNVKNEVISNDATSVKLQFKTEEDRLFVFFNAFQTEISSDYYQNVIVEGKPDSIVAQPTEQISETKEFLEEKERVSEPVLAVNQPENAVQERSEDLLEMINANSVEVPGLVSGYYVVNHVFSSAKNADNWAKKMVDAGFSPKQFVRPSNGFHYVYIDFSQDPDALYNRVKGYRKMKDLTKCWMLKINLE